MVPLPRFAGQDEASGTAEAPSTALRAVPLPRFAGQDEVRFYAARGRIRGFTSRNSLMALSASVSLSSV